MLRLSDLRSLMAPLDINRERVVAKLKLDALLDRLNREGQADIAIGVLCNLCLDYGSLPAIPLKEPG